MTQIKTVKAKASDVGNLMDFITEAVVDDWDDDTVMLACLGIAILIQDPDVKRERFMEVIQSTSEYIALQLATAGEVVN